MHETTEATERAYRFTLRFFAELRALGVSEVVLSPGSRSTPLALSARAVGMTITVQHDERVAAFHALGMAKESRQPSVLICSSGTAGANYHPAVIEAHHAEIPLIICTADRPPELRQWGAGQTIDQTHLYGTSVRWFHDLPVPSEVDQQHAAALALRAVQSSTSGRGPVHLNWPLREPLHPSTPLEAPQPSLEPISYGPPSEPSTRLQALAETFDHGLVVVGPADLDPLTASQIRAFSRSSGWPIIADPASGLRSGVSADSAAVVTAGELLFGDPEFVRTIPQCDVVVRVGLSPTSKAYRLWVESSRPPHLVLVDPGPDWSDPTSGVTEVVRGPVAGLFQVQEEAPEKLSSWALFWQQAQARAQAAITTCLADDQGELGVVHRTLAGLASLGGASNLVVSNSMPIRHLDVSMTSTSAQLRVLANRGANGIDGVISTAAGVASRSESRTWVLVGDVATLHDLGGLAAIPRLGISGITLVVIDNNAGGIFSLLPVAEAVESATFDELFATPHSTDFASLGSALGYVVTETTALEGFEVADAPDGSPRLIVVHCDVETMTNGMHALRQAVSDALTR